MADDFLKQIQEAEAQAEALRTEAEHKIREAEEQTKKDLEAKRSEALAQKRQEGREMLASKQKDARSTYEQLLKEGKSDADALKRKIEPSIAKSFPAVEAYFLNDLLA